jgi:16S rRNA (uracil1498-N3)-methyltransferase
MGGAPLTSVAEPGPAAILIGPEGGFTDEERAAIRAVPQAKPVALGPRILRADTAAVAAVSLWMAVAGDWSRAPRSRKQTAGE